MAEAGFSFLTLERSGDELRAVIRIEAGGPWFAGHFPGAPVLPAIAQFDLLCRVHRAAGGSGRLAELDRVRLARPVRPGDRLELTLRPGPAGGERFTLRTAGGEAVSDGVARWLPAENG